MKAQKLNLMVCSSIAYTALLTATILLYGVNLNIHISSLKKISGILKKKIKKLIKSSISCVEVSSRMQQIQF